MTTENGAIKRIVTVLNPAGLHARPSLAVVQAVRASQSKVRIATSRQSVDAGDILQILGLGAVQGTQLELSATGPDAKEVLHKLGDLFANSFGLCGEP
jgi:phosphotransferase system HPr (HPr) family protein